MHLARLELKNWKNFAEAKVDLESRVFIIGNNGAGKSNLLDAFRFLRDIANPKGGGIQNAVGKRGGMKKIRNFGSRQNSDVSICVEMNDSDNNKWRYKICFEQENSVRRRVLVTSEEVMCNNELRLNRPDDDDNKDSARRTQTALEQIAANGPFRVLAEFFQGIKYIHIVPQLIRYGSEIQGNILPDDPFGQDFMNAVAAANQKTRDSRLRRIGEALQEIKPAYEKGHKMDLRFERDEKTGKPHLKFKYPNWRKNDVVGTEEILSDGELRLIGLLWTLMESHSMILLEEPEISFNEAIVEALPDIFTKAMESKKKKGRQQVIASTHSYPLLDDEGIGEEEILLLEENDEGTCIVNGADHSTIKENMEQGLSVARSSLRFAQRRPGMDKLFQ